MGIPLNAPLTPHTIVYTLPMLTIKEDKGETKSVNAFTCCMDNQVA